MTTQTAIAVPVATLDTALNARFMQHIEHSVPPITPDHETFFAIQRKFVDSLSKTQQAAYSELEAMLATIEATEQLHFFLLGFKDGHPVLGGLKNA